MTNQDLAEELAHRVTDRPTDALITGFASSPSLMELAADDMDAAVDRVTRQAIAVVEAAAEAFRERMREKVA